ncbi:MAG: ATP-dependent DNA helicase RecG [Patescibacteria group bacterium]
MELSALVSQLSRVGKTASKRLAYLGVNIVKDLLYYFPFRYEDYRTMVPISQLQHGQMVTICGQVQLIANKRSFKRRKIITEALVADKTGAARVVWFNQPFIIKNIHVGDVVYLSGKVQTDMLGPQLASPTYEKYKKDPAHTARLVPIYSLTFGLTQKQIRSLTNQVITLAGQVEEWLPKEILEKADLTPLSDALRGIHFPADDNDLKQSVERLKFDELFLIQLKAELSRLEKSGIKAPKINFKEAEVRSFVSSLPFQLTKTQKISAWEIFQDLEKSAPMSRLLSGDVGSGKTVIAAMAMLNACLNGFRSVFMAPTEILASQHYNSLIKLFGDKFSVGLLTGSQFAIHNYKFEEKSQAGQKKEFFKKIGDGELSIVVGTHALFSEGVEYKKLGLVIVDEQHRFGVEQRKTIKEKGRGVHFLSMTATPIPRSLALVIYGDLDVSIINELPPGRKKIITKLVEPAKRDKAYQFIRDQVKQGRQIFVVCPLIERKEDEAEIEIINYPANPSNEKKSVLSEYEKLSKNIFPDLRVGYLHGKLKGKEKERIMSDFKNGKLDLLVSTSVVEVGVDIPNASVMMIEGAEGFGLAQLHQFRGRVGRSIHQSYCLLFTHSDSVKASERLSFFEKNNDGFKLAEKDLEMRGPGEVYGTEQSGMMNLRIAQLNDRELIKKTRELAKETAVDLEKYPVLNKKMKDWEKSVHLE